MTRNPDFESKLAGLPTLRKAYLVEKLNLSQPVTV